MYWHTGRKQEYEIHPQDGERAREAAKVAQDVAESMPLKDAAMQRRLAIKDWRLAQMFGNTKRMAEEVARARTIRRVMERRINK